MARDRCDPALGEGGLLPCPAQVPGCPSCPCKLTFLSKQALLVQPCTDCGVWNRACAPSLWAPCALCSVSLLPFQGTGARLSKDRCCRSNRPVAPPAQRAPPSTALGNLSALTPLPIHKVSPKLLRFESPGARSPWGRSVSGGHCQC